MISLQTNIDSLVAQQNLNTNSMFQSNTIQQLTSGYRINSSADDAAGLAVANADRDQIAQITQGVANGNNGTAQLQIMDGGMSNISQILDRLQTLATEAASSSSNASTRTALNQEFQTDITELNRQAQAIGLNTGGTYATTLDVYLGGGGGASAAAVSQDGQVQVNLANSAVDSKALGLTGAGMQVVAGTTDISSNSTTHSAYDIVTNANNIASEASNGSTIFYLSGPGFSDGSKVALSVDLAGVSDTNTLVTAINNAINNAAANTAGALSASAATALKTAGITASVNTDTSGGQELAFSSNTTAFQVEAGDQMSNALMGNLSTNPTTAAQGLAVATTVTGAATAGMGAFNPTGVTVQISGASLASPVKLTLTGDTTMTEALNGLKSQVAGNAALQAAGITVTTATPGSALVFTSATGETFSVQATGDTANALGLGSLDNSSTGASAAFYSTITGGNYSSMNTGNGLATLGFSLNGGSTDGGLTPAQIAANTAESAAIITGTAPSGITAGALVNTTTLGSTPLTLTVNNQSVDVNFNLDANRAANESLANVVKYINSQVNAAMGWGSNVQLATIAGSNGSSTINLTDPYADSNSSIVVGSTSTATALGLSGSATGTDAVGNTVTVNLAGGDATAASATSSASATAMSNGILTSGGGTVNFTVDGQTVSANFANDTTQINGIAANAGTAAVLTGSQLGPLPSSQINLSSLQAQAASVTGIGFGSGATSVDTSGLEAQPAVFVGNGVPGDNFAAITANGAGGIMINGVQVDLTTTPAPTTLEGLMADINATAGIGVTAAIQTASNGNEALALTSTATGAGSGFTITDSTGAQNAGLTSGSDVQVDAGYAAQTLSVTFATGGAQTISFAGASPTETFASIAGAINTQLNAALSAGQGLTYASFTAGGALKIADARDTTGAGTVSIANNAAAEALGLSSDTQTGPTTGAGVAAQKLTLNIDGIHSETVDFSGLANASTATVQQVATYINTTLNAKTGDGYSASQVYATVGAAGSATPGALIISGTLTGAADSASGAAVVVGSGAAATTLGLNTSSGTKTVYGQDESVANVVSYLNTVAQQALGTSTGATIFSANPLSGAISIASQTKGAASAIAVGTPAGAGAGILTGLGLTAGTTLATGTGPSLASIASTLTQAFKANTALSDAGLQATASGNALQIQSENATSFRLAEYNTATVGGDTSTLGFTATGGPFSAALTSGNSQATLMDAGGTSAIGTGTTANPYLSFTPMQFGSDTQALTFTANNAAGVQQPLTITLSNSTVAGSGSTSGSSIDSAVAYINAQLQASKNPTLQSIVAVKENVAGTEEINFLSSLSSFSVSVGNSINGKGLNDGLANTFGSVANGAANNSAIDTLAGAQSAVTAVTNAVAQLGTAQAAVGIGENQVNYAVNLAQSQITNISSAESQIRDANVAQQAANMTKASVLEQATIAAMAQANQEPQAVLKLLQQ